MATLLDDLKFIFTSLLLEFIRIHPPSCLCAHMCVFSLSLYLPRPPQALPTCPRLCYIFQTAAVTAETVVLFPAGSWESCRINDAENSSLHKERVKLADESSLGESQVSIWRAQECQWEDRRLGESLRLWCSSVFTSNPSSGT